MYFFVILASALASVKFNRFPDVRALFLLLEVQWYPTEDLCSADLVNAVCSSEFRRQALLKQVKFLYEWFCTIPVTFNG